MGIFSPVHVSGQPSNGQAGCVHLALHVDVHTSSSLQETLQTGSVPELYSPKSHSAAVTISQRQQASNERLQRILPTMTKIANSRAPSCMMFRLVRLHMGYIPEAPNSTLCAADASLQGHQAVEGRATCKQPWPAAQPAHDGQTGAPARRCSAPAATR